VSSRYGGGSGPYIPPSRTYESHGDNRAYIDDLIAWFNAESLPIAMTDSWGENLIGQPQKTFAPSDIRRSAWKLVMAGGLAASYRGDDGYFPIASIQTDFESEQWLKPVNPFVQSRLGTTFGAMVPTPSLVTNGYCLADPARTKLLYFLMGNNDAWDTGNGGDVTVKLTGLSGSYGAIWFNPRTGVETSVSGTPFAGGSDYSIAPPSTDDWVLLLSSTIVVFSSQWLTALGTSDAARRDTSNPVANGGPFLGNTESAHSVVSGSTFNWPYGNCLQIEQGFSGPRAGSVFIGDGAMNSAIPANTDYYFRIYVNVWDVYANRYGSRHPVNASLQTNLTLWSCVDATPDKSQYRPGLMRAYTLNGGSQGDFGNPSGYMGGFWWPGHYPVGNSPVCHADFWLDQQHWYLFEAHVHYIDVAQQRFFFGSYGVYDAENNYNQIGDLSDYTNGSTGGGQSLEQARLDGAFTYKGLLTSDDPSDIIVYPYTGTTYPWQIMIGTEGNAAQVPTFPYERHLYAAPAVAIGGFPPRLAAL
jgi:hypothetical protein